MLHISLNLVSSTSPTMASRTMNLTKNKIKLRTQFLCSQQLQKYLGHLPQDISASSTHISKNVQLKREMGD